MIQESLRQDLLDSPESMSAYYDVDLEKIEKPLEDSKKEERTIMVQINLIVDKVLRRTVKSKKNLLKSVNASDMVNPPLVYATNVM